MRRFVLVGLVVVLAGCGAPAATNAPTAQPTPPLATFGPRPTAVELAPLATTTPVAVPTSPAAQPAEAMPAEGTPAAPAANLAAAVQGYATLVVLKGTASALERMAAQTPESSSTIDVQSLAKLIAAAGVLKTAGASLQGNAPAPALNDAWAQGRTLAPELSTLVSDWTTKQTAGDIAARLAALQPQLDAMIASAESGLNSALGIDSATLHQRRDAVLATLRDTLQVGE